MIATRKRRDSGSSGEANGPSLPASFKHVEIVALGIIPVCIEGQYHLQLRKWLIKSSQIINVVLSFFTKVKLTQCPKRLLLVIEDPSPMLFISGHSHSAIYIPFRVSSSLPRIKIARAL
jgi:hypothetical protein